MFHCPSSLKPLTFTAVASILIACGPTDDASREEALDGAPELAAVELRLTGDTSAEGLATEEDSVAPESLVADELEATTNEAVGAEVAGALGSARTAIKELNQSMRDVLVSIAALVRNREADQELGDVKRWGPVERGATEYRFLLRRAAPLQFGWRLDARLIDSGADYQPVAAGILRRGLQARRGVGTMGFDLDTLGSLDPTVAARGKILAGFAHGERGTTVRYALQNFSRSGAPDGIDALVGQVHLDGGVGRVRLAYRGNVEGTETDAEELVLARVRHTRAEGGRSDALITGGDVPEAEVRLESQCWNANLTSVYRIVRSCPVDGIGAEACAVLSTDGDVAECASPFASAELPPLDPNEPMADDTDPNADLQAPTELPAIEGIDES